MISLPTTLVLDSALRTMAGHFFPSRGHASAEATLVLGLLFCAVFRGGAQAEPAAQRLLLVSVVHTLVGVRAVGGIGLRGSAVDGRCGELVGADGGSNINRRALEGQVGCLATGRRRRRVVRALLRVVWLAVAVFCRWPSALNEVVARGAWRREDRSRGRLPDEAEDA